MKIRTFLLSAILSTTALTASAADAKGRQVIIDQARFQQMTAVDQAHVLELKDRLETVLATDRSSLSTEERKALRKEWRALKGEMQAANGGGTVIYLSTAGIIIIILLLIILL